MVGFEMQSICFCLEQMKKIINIFMGKRSEIMIGFCIFNKIFKKREGERKRQRYVRYILKAFMSLLLFLLYLRKKSCLQGKTEWLFFTQVS